LGHISGVPAEELLAAFVPAGAVAITWLRITGRRRLRAARARRG
jgi:hypothetical protein